MFRDRDQFEPGINHYVPAMQYSNAINSSQPQQFSLGAPAANAVLKSGVAANAAIGTIVSVDLIVPEPYGRVLIFTPSGDPGVSGGQIEWRGFDYLGQPMLTRVAGVNGSSSAIAGLKAFKRIHSAKIVTTSTNAVTWSITSGDALGLPYRGDVIWAREGGAMVTVGAQFVPGDRTDPATSATGDPRGTYNPTAAFDGIKEFIVGIIGDPSLTATGNGGLHGIKQYYA
jgi:hypothetical protein